MTKGGLTGAIGGAVGMEKGRKAKTSVGGPSAPDLDEDLGAAPDDAGGGHASIQLLQEGGMAQAA